MLMIKASTDNMVERDIVDFVLETISSNFCCSYSWSDTVKLKISELDMDLLNRIHQYQNDVHVM